MNSEPDITHSEVELKGAPASPGYAIGKAKLYEKQELDIQSSTIKNKEVLDHINEFKKARIKTESELQSLQEEANDRNAADIVSAQIEMVNDPELANHVEKLIKEELYSVDFAIQEAFESYIKLIANSGNMHTRERSVDISDIRDRLLEYVKKQSAAPTIEDGCIVVTNDLSPREVISLMNHNIAGIIMDRGGATSHAAIIARSMGIPAIVGAKQAMDSISLDDMIAMDGESGKIIVHPSRETIRQLRQTIELNRQQEEQLNEVVERESKTGDGQPFTLRANIEFAEELDKICKVNAAGIGLLRTESIYLEREHFEDIQKQERFYSSILEGTGNEPVTIRLFDAGGDKIFNGKHKEKNPFLGWRGIRMLLDNRELLRDQLYAVLATAADFPGRVSILVPMVTLVEEVVELKKEIRNIQQDLRNEGKNIDEDVQLGIMIEVPGVALQADKFAGMVDFFSIGTNDLTQYVLAVDRGNELIAGIYDQRHPAVWELIKLVSDAARSYGKNVTLCGELASDPVSAACLMGMGINDLSMSPSRITHVKDVLLKNTFADMKELADKVLKCTTSEEVHELFENWSN